MCIKYLLPYGRSNQKPGTIYWQTSANNKGSQVTSHPGASNQGIVTQPYGEDTQTLGYINLIVKQVGAEPHCPQTISPGSSKTSRQTNVPSGQETGRDSTNSESAQQQDIQEIGRPEYSRTTKGVWSITVLYLQLMETLKRLCHIDRSQEYVNIKDYKLFY